MIVDENLLYGILAFASMFLAIVAAIIGISMFRASHKRKEFWSWKILILGLITYTIHKLFGALDAFNMYQTATGWMSQVFPILVQAFVLWAVILQIYISTR